MPDILHRVGIGAIPAKVFMALTTIEGIRSWWDSTDATGEAKEGGTFNLSWASFKVVEANPDTLVKWKVAKGPADWLDTEITFKLVWKQDQTFVLFTHASWKEPDEFMQHCSTKWGIFLLSLKDYVEKGKGRPAPDDIRSYVGERENM